MRYSPTRPPAPTEAHGCEQLAQSCYSTMRRPGVEPATSRSQVQHPTTTLPIHGSSSCSCSCRCGCSCSCKLNVINIIAVIVNAACCVDRGMAQISVCTSTRLKSLTARTPVPGQTKPSHGVKLRRLLHRSKWVFMSSASLGSIQWRPQIMMATTMMDTNHNHDGHSNEDMKN